jgi:hypothetical protein
MSAAGSGFLVTIVKGEALAKYNTIEQGGRFHQN